MTREGGREGWREGRGRGDRRGSGAPICDLSNHQLKSTLMVPGPDAHQRCTSGLSALQHSGKSKFIRLSPRFFGVTHYFSPVKRGCSSQHEAAADLTRSRNDAIIEMNASEVSSWFPLRRRLSCSALQRKKGVRVRHVKMIRRETSSSSSSAQECVTLYQPQFLHLFTKFGHIIAPENRTLDFLNRQEKAKVAMVTLKCP